jgi:lysyl-tRNA synthetase class 2
MTVSPWWAPHVYADRRPFLTARARIAAAVRAWFAARDFVEVETAILQVSPGNEAHLHAFATELIAPDASRMPLYLHTSPEFAARSCSPLAKSGSSRWRVYPQSRTRAAASSRVHHARVVSGR